MCRIWLDAGFATRSSDPLADRVTVVGGVGKDMLGRVVFEERLSLRSITTLVRRQMQMHGTPPCIDGRMIYRGQSAARSTEAAPLIGIPLLVGALADRLDVSPARRREPADD